MKSVNDILIEISFVLIDLDKMDYTRMDSDAGMNSEYQPSVEPLQSDTNQETQHDKPLILVKVN